MITREAAVAQMKADVELSLKTVPGWSDQIIWQSLVTSQEFTPNQLIAEVQLVPETEIAKEFMDMYIANLEMEERLKQAMSGMDSQQLMQMLLGLGPDPSGLDLDEEPEADKDDKPVIH